MGMNVASRNVADYYAWMKNITRMSLKELLAHEAAVQKQITTTKVATLTKLRADFQRATRSAGLGETDLLLATPAVRWGTSAPTRAPRVIDISTVERGVSKLVARRSAAKRVGNKVAVKYRNKRTGETWTGRGKMATWLATAIKGGRKLESFLVK